MTTHRQYYYINNSNALSNAKILKGEWLSLAEQVSEERFEDFKQEVRNSFADIKETLGSRMSELTGEIKAYNQIAQSQGQKLIGLEKDIEVSKNHIEKLQDKVDTNILDINTVKTELGTTQKNNRNTLYLILFIFAIIEFFLNVLPKIKVGQ
jgi:chromosome segregation ATPase